jgi:hypothetical protein
VQHLVSNAAMHPNALCMACKEFASRGVRLVPIESVHVIEGPICGGELVVGKMPRDALSD